MPILYVFSLLTATTNLLLCFKNTARLYFPFEGDQCSGSYLTCILTKISGTLAWAELNPKAVIVLLVSLCWNRRESEHSVPQRKYTAYLMLTLLLWLAYFDHLIFSLILMYSREWTLSLSCNLILLSFKCSEGQWIFLFSNNMNSRSSGNCSGNSSFCCDSSLLGHHGENVSECFWVFFCPDTNIISRSQNNSLYKLIPLSWIISVWIC